MLIVSYDISDNKLRNRFSTFLKKFGFRLQYSVFQIKNSTRLLENIKSEVEGKFAKSFAVQDSVIIFHMSKNCKIIKYGYSRSDDEEFIIIG